jgi:hypothetical protein
MSCMLYVHVGSALCSGYVTFMYSSSPQPSCLSESHLTPAALPRGLRTTTARDRSGAGTGARKAFEAAFTTDLARLIHVDASRVKITSITAGSVVVRFVVLPDLSGKALAPSSLTNAFKAKGVAIGGAKSTSAITSSDTTTTSTSTSSSSSSKQLTRDTSGQTSLQTTSANKDDDDGMGWALIVAIVAVTLGVIASGVVGAFKYTQNRWPWESADDKAATDASKPTGADVTLNPLEVDMDMEVETPDGMEVETPDEVAGDLT